MKDYLKRLEPLQLPPHSRPDTLCGGFTDHYLVERKQQQAASLVPGTESATKPPEPPEESTGQLTDDSEPGTGQQ